MTIAVVRSAVSVLVLGVLAAGRGYATDTQLQSVAIRAKLGEKQVLGKDQLESFQYYDTAATLRLPWELEFFSSGWGIGTRLLASAGILEGANKYAGIVAGVPALAFGRLDGRITVEAGAGLAVFSNHQFAQQTYGGPLQFAVTLGVGVPLYGPWGAGFRFLHYSDWGVYGDHTIGADFQIVELTYHF